MVSFKKSKNYIHSSLLDEDGIFKPKPILAVGGTGSGKSIYVSDCVEELEYNHNSITFHLVDVSDTLEGAFSIFPATEKYHLEKLKYQFEQPTASPNKVKLWCFYGRNLKVWNKQEKLPDMQIVTLGIKSILQRNEGLFLLETEKENKALRLLMNCGENLKGNEGIKFVRHYGKKLTLRKKITYLGRQVDSGEEPVADASDLKDVLGSLHFIEDCIMPQDYKMNFDIKSLLKTPKVRHVVVYKGLKKDDKVRDFFFYHILNELARNIQYCKYPVNLVIEEIQSKAPYKGQGYKAVLSAKVGDITGTIRKTGRGVTIFLVGRSWTRIAEEVRTECRKQIIFHLEQDDMLKFVKVRNLGKKAKTIIEKLNAGEYVHRGDETKICQSKMPMHGHKHVNCDFMVEYRKFFKDKLRKYNDEIKEIEQIQKEQDQMYNRMLKAEQDREKRRIKQQVIDRAKSEKDKEEIEKLKDQQRARLSEQKANRDKLILDTLNELKQKGEKISYRIIAKLVTDKGTKVSFGTVKNVLDNSSPTDRDVSDVKE